MGSDPAVIADVQLCPPAGSRRIRGQRHAGDLPACTGDDVSSVQLRPQLPELLGRLERDHVGGELVGRVGDREEVDGEERRSAATARRGLLGLP